MTPRRSHRLLSFLLITGIGLGFVLMFVGQAIYRARVLHLDLSIPNLLIEAFSRWPLYMAMAPLVGMLVARWPLERRRLSRRLPFHVAAAFVFSIVHAAGMMLILRSFDVNSAEYPLGEAIERLLLNLFTVNFIIFWVISGVYHTIRYHREALAREQLAASLRARLGEARLDFLRAQLHPHFLFNALNAVSTQVLTGQPEQVVRTLSRLSDLLRITFDGELPQEVPLEQEMGMLEGYLDIQRIRFGERLTIVPEVAAEARPALLPSLMLQPLVENALHHGIEKRPGPGRVTIMACRRNGALCVRVEDTGPGFAPDHHDQSPGIGLSNTRARLEELYGPAQSLELGNQTGGGAFVEVQLPFHTEPAGEVGA